MLSASVGAALASTRACSRATDERVALGHRPRRSGSAPCSRCAAQALDQLLHRRGVHASGARRALRRTPRGSRRSGPGPRAGPGPGAAAPRRWAPRAHRARAPARASRAAAPAPTSARAPAAARPGAARTPASAAASSIAWCDRPRDTPNRWARSSSRALSSMQRARERQRVEEDQLVEPGRPAASRRSTGTSNVWPLCATSRSSPTNSRNAGQTSAEGRLIADVGVAVAVDGRRARTDRARRVRTSRWNCSTTPGRAPARRPARRPRTRRRPVSVVSRSNAT